MAQRGREATVVRAGPAVAAERVAPSSVRGTSSHALGAQAVVDRVEEQPGHRIGRVGVERTVQRDRRDRALAVTPGRERQQRRRCGDQVRFDAAHNIRPQIDTAFDITVDPLPGIVAHRHADQEQSQPGQGIVVEWRDRTDAGVRLVDGSDTGVVDRGTGAVGAIQFCCDVGGGLRTAGG